MSLEHLAGLAKVADRAARELEAPVTQYAAWVRETIEGGGTLLIAGNGGSAAHAQHVATEYVVRYRGGTMPRRAAPAIALSTDSSLLTAAANDLGFEQVFARQIEAHAGPGDLVVLVSTSGNSANLLRAAAAARTAGARTVALLGGDGGRLKPLVDLAIVVPSDDSAHVQEVQLAIDHHVCGMVEARMQEAEEAKRPKSVKDSDQRPV